MGKPETFGSIQIYDDKFKFVEAKKFLTLKGPLSLKVVHDHMYPLWRYGHELIIKRVDDKNFKVGLPICFWRDEVYHPCLIKEIKGNGNLIVTFMNAEHDFGEVEPQFVLGQVAHPKIGLWSRLKAFFRV